MSRGATKTILNPKLLGRCRQKGNTLVPVVIGLGIAAVATLAFLNQGNDITANNNRIVAINEIAKILNDYNTIRSIGEAVADINAGQVTGFNATNVYRVTNNTWNAANGLFTYTTDSNETCLQLLAVFNDTIGVDINNPATCENDANNDPLVLSLNLN